MIHILTHRGLEPAKDDYFSESSYEAFEDQLKRNYGLEIDLQFTKDGEIIISHERDLASLNFKEALNKKLDRGHLTGLNELLALFENITAKTKREMMLAIHLKGRWQEKEYLDILLHKLSWVDHSNFIIFDLKPEPAKYLKMHDPKLHLAASVAHAFDIKRYNKATGNTLISIDEVLKLKNIFDWVWLDEWDKIDEKGVKKSLYTKSNFLLLRKAGFKIGVVSPELHALSPGLLGGEKHEDASNKKVLLARVTEILSLKPDVICTDYPEEAMDILNTQRTYIKKMTAETKRQLRKIGVFNLFFHPCPLVSLKKKVVDFLLVRIEKLSGKFITVHTRPIFAKDYQLLSDELFEFPKTAVVMQGTIIKSVDFTLETLKIYKKNFKNSILILSTWDSEDAEYVEKIRAEGIEVVLNSKPSYAGPSNINYQLVSTYNGILRAAELGALYVIKTRSDYRMYGINIMETFLNLLNMFPIDNDGLTQRKRIVALLPKYFYYGFCDIFLFGDIEDVKTYWGTDHIKADPKADMRFLNVELYLTIQFLKKVGHEPKWSLLDSWKTFSKLCIALDISIIDGYWYKYDRYKEYRYAKDYRERSLEKGILSFAEWLNLYKGLENKKPTRISERIFFRSLKP